MTPYEIGHAEASERRAFAPEMYYARASDKAEYALGFHLANNSIIARDYYDAYVMHCEQDGEAERAYDYEVYMMGKAGGM